MIAKGACFLFIPIECNFDGPKMLHHLDWQAKGLLENKKWK